MGCYSVEDHVYLLSCVIIYDVQETIRDWRVDLWYHQHLLRNQENLSVNQQKDQADNISIYIIYLARLGSKVIRGHHAFPPGFSKTA